MQPFAFCLFLGTCLILLGANVSAQESSASTAVTPRDTEETTANPRNDDVDKDGKPNIDLNLIKWVQYQKTRDGVCYKCGCYQLKDLKHTCECFNDYIHAKANFWRHMYIKKSAWTTCHEPVLTIKVKSDRRKVKN